MFEQVTEMAALAVADARLELAVAFQAPLSCFLLVGCGKSG